MQGNTSFIVPALVCNGGLAIIGVDFFSTDKIWYHVLLTTYEYHKGILSCKCDGNSYMEGQSCLPQCLPLI